MTTTELKEPQTPAATQNEDSSTSKSINVKKVTRVENVVVLHQERDKESFYKDLQNFHENRNTPITRFPKVSGKEVDLHKLYSEVISRGGWLKVNIRNEWEDLISVVGLSHKCVNASVALKHIYTRFLDKYEKLNFFGEDPDRNDELLDDDSRHKKWSSKNCTQTIPMTYNYNQHNVSENTRIQHKLSTDLYKSSEYEKLLLSLMSPLPNEQDFAINVCTLMSNESKHTLKIENCPKLLDCLMAHTGVYCHSSMRNHFQELYSNIRNHSLQSFWNDCLKNNTQILELSYDDCFSGSDEPKAIERIKNPSQALEKESFEDGLFADDSDIDLNKLDFLALGRGLGTHEYIGQRVQQIASIIRNLSFFEENITILAKNRTFIRFLVLCSNVRWGSLHHMALDIWGNIATEIDLLDPATDDLTRCLLASICDGLEGDDRGVIISCLEILNKLCQNDLHNDYLHKCLNQKMYNQICLYLSLNDIMLLLYTLECIYALSSLGHRACNSLIQVRGIIDTLVSLITVEAQSYGPDGCILMRVVETVPGNMLPMVAKNIANLQNVTMQSQVNIQQLQQIQQQQQIQNQENVQRGQTTPVRIPAVIAVAQQSPMIPNLQTTPVNKPVQSLQENEQFAISWLTATFEMAPSAASRVEQQELYKMYISAISKTGRRGSVTQSHFPRIVRSIFGTNIGPTLLKITDSNGTETTGFFYVCIRVRANPLPLKGTIPISQTSKTPVKQQFVQQQQTNELVNKQIGKIEVGLNQQQTSKIINIKPTIVNAIQSIPKHCISSVKIKTQPHQLQLNDQQNNINNNNNNLDQLREKYTNLNKLISINKNIQKQQHHQVVLPYNNSPNNLDLTTGGLTKNPAVNHLVVNKNITPQQSHFPQQMQQQQQKVLPHGSTLTQIVKTTTIGQTTMTSTQISNSALNSNTGQIGSGGQGMPQNSSSLIKSLLANKVTTTSANTNISTTETNIIVNAASNNNQSGLISQNLNLHHQLAQRQNLAKQKEVAVQQQQQHQQLMQQQQQQQQQQSQIIQTPTKLATTTISALVNNPIIQSTPVKVGQTTIKPINPNTIDKKTIILPTESIEASSNWDPVPPLAPLSGATRQIQSTIVINSNTGIIQSSEDSNSTGNNSVTSSSAISSSQIPMIDDGDNSMISFEGLLIPKSKSATSSTIDDDNSKDSINKVGSHVINANQMLVDLLDKKSPDPPLTGHHGIKRKLNDDIVVVTTSNDKKKILKTENQITPSKNAANLYAEMAASILEDEDLEDAPTTNHQTLQKTQASIQKTIIEPQKQIITMPIQRQIIMNQNSQHQQVLIQGNSSNSGNIINTNNQQATATIKTDSGLQTIPLILQKQIGPNGQQIIQPVIQHQQQQQQTQYVLATNPQGQTYLVAQQAPQSQQPQQQQTLLLTQTNQQQGSGPTKTIIILQQQGGPPQAVAQQQLISTPGQPQKMIMTTPHGQQMIVTQMPRPVQHHQIIMNPGTSVLQTTSGGNGGGNGQNVVITQSGNVFHHQQQQHHIGQIQKQIQMQQHQSQQHLQIQQNVVQQQQLTALQQQQQASILSQLPQIPATIKLHTHQPIATSVIQQTQTTQTQTLKVIPKQQTSTLPSVSIISQTGGHSQVQQQLQHQGQIIQQVVKTNSLPVERKQIIVSGNEIIKQQTQQIQNQQIQNQQIQNQQMQKQVQQKQIIQQQGKIQQTQQQQIQQQVQQIQQHAQQQIQHKQQQLLTTQNQQITSQIQQHQVTVNASKTPTIPTNILNNPSGAPPVPPPSPRPLTPNVAAARSTPTPPILAPSNPTPPPPPVSPLLPKPKTEEELIELNWVWICDWRGCPRRKFKSLQEVYRHACQVHCPDNLDPGAEIFCQWGPGQTLCDNIPRKRFSLMTHLLDRHCTIDSLKAAVQRRLINGLPAPPGPHQPVTIIKNTSEIKGTASPTLSTSSSSSVPSAASAAMHAIKRHTNDFLNPKELMDENEGPVTKSIRLTAALILRNLVMYTANAKRNIRYYEPHLAGVALSNVESSRTISQILYELNN